MRTIRPITWLNDMFVYFFVKKIGKYKKNQNSSIFNENTDDYSKKLNEKGYVQFKTKISNFRVGAIVDKSKNFKCHDPYNKIGGFDLNTIPEETHLVNYFPSDLIAIKEIAEIASDPNILNVVSDFLGCKPTLSSVNMWKSLEGKENAKAAQNFHRDMDDFKFVKLFIYLTNVDMESGPHVYIESSSIDKSFRKIGRFNDQEIEAHYGANKVKYFTEPMGSVFFVDTFGIHKGLLPKGKNRLLLQLEYSINPIIAYDYKKVTPPISEFDPYVFRLFY